MVFAIYPVLVVKEEKEHFIEGLVLNLMHWEREREREREREIERENLKDLKVHHSLACYSELS